MIECCWRILLRFRTESPFESVLLKLPFEFPIDLVLLALPFKIGFALPVDLVLLESSLETLMGGRIVIVQLNFEKKKKRKEKNSKDLIKKGGKKRFQDR